MTLVLVLVSDNSGDCQCTETKENHNCSMTVSLLEVVYPHCEAKNKCLKIVGRRGWFALPG